MPVKDYDDPRPDYLERGEKARLLPTNLQERHAVSALLAALTVVPPFTREVAAILGQTMRQSSCLSALTEIVFSSHPDDRPDGLIIIETPRRQWRALVECKIGPAKLNAAQLERYCLIAKANGIDAVLTINNESTPFGNHLPYERPAVCPTTCGDLQLFHISWFRFVSIAMRLLESDEVYDTEQAYILSELVRYLTYDSGAIRPLQSMCADWQPVAQQLYAEALLNVADDRVRRVVRCWHELEAAMAMSLEREMQGLVSVKLRRQHREDQGARIGHDAEILVSGKRLQATFDAPQLAAPIVVIADVNKRAVICKQRIGAPLDRQQYRSRLGWLLRQLPEETDLSPTINIEWSEGLNSTTPLNDLREDRANSAQIEGARLPIAFEIVSFSSLDKNFLGPSKFIAELEIAVLSFYDQLARHIKAWHPPVLAVVATKAADEPIPPSRQVIHSGTFPWGTFEMFADASVELTTPKAKRWFKDMAEMERALLDGSPLNGSTGSPEPDPASRGEFGEGLVGGVAAPHAGVLE